MWDAYVYDAMNQRVSVAKASGTNEFIYDYAGRRISTWIASTNTGSEGRIYWDGKQIAFRSLDGTTYFDQQNWIGTERMRTNYAGTAVAAYGNLPYGDGSSQVVSTTGQNQDNMSFALLDLDSETSTEHAQYRQYGYYSGHWESPDPYSGSYDFTNPQSLNRYSYVTNNPLVFNDPSGQFSSSGDGDDRDDGDPPIIDPRTFQSCGMSLGTEGANPVADVLCGWGLIKGLVGYFTRPSFHGSLQPRPNVYNWDGSNFDPASIISGAIGLPRNDCEFGACGDIGNALEPGSTASVSSFCSKHPSLCQWAANGLAYLKSHPVFISANEIAAGQITFQYSTRTICANVGLGASVPPTKAFTVGLYNAGNMAHWKDVVSGYGYSFGANLIGGYQASTNSSGTIGGPTISGVGLSGSYTYGGCTTVP